MFEASRSHGLLITVDEIQDASLAEMRELGNEIQLLIRQGANVAFAFAGLPASIDGVVVDETLTFLQRAKCVELTRLSDYEVGDSFEETMAKANRTIGDEAAQLLVSAAAGYPFMVQLVGYYAWQASSRRDSSEVTLEDAKRGVEIARKSFDNMVIAPALRRVSQRQLEYLVAMARCGEGPVATGTVAKRLGVEPSGVSSYRKRLIDAAIVESPEYGLVNFAIPYMREYLLAHMAERG